MASYNSILRHVSMADVKRNTWKLQEQKRIDEQRRQEEIDLRKYNNSPLYSDWRFDLSENMTTQAMTYATTLPAEGDTVLTDVSSQSGDMGTVEGLEVDGEIKFGTIEPNDYDSFFNWNQTAVTRSYDTRLLSTLSFTLAVGTGADAPRDIHPLKVYYTSASGATGQLSGNLLSSGTYNFELPAAAQSSATTFKFEVRDDDVSSNGNYSYQYQYRYAVGRTFRGGIVQDNLADDGYSAYSTGREIWTLINNDVYDSYTDDQKSSYMNTFPWGGIIGMDPSPESGNSDGFPSTSSERIAYFDLMRSTFADLDGKTSRTFTVSNVGLKRRTPITVFVALDSPEASAFVRTGGFSEYSNEEKKKQLEQMMKASDDYLFSVYGDLFPGTGAVGFDDVADPTSWEQAAQGGDPYNIRWPKNSDVPKTKQYYDKHMKQWVTAPVKKASSGGGDEIAQEPSLLQKGLEKQTGGEMAPMPIEKQPTGGNMPTPSGYDLLDQDPKETTLAKKNGKKKQPVVAHYEPDGEVIMDVPSQQISFSDFRLITVDNVNEDMTVSALTYAATSLEPKGDTVLDSAEGWGEGTAPGANYGLGGVTSDGSTLFLDAGNIDIADTGGGLQQAIAQSKGMDTRQFDTARVTVIKTYDAGDDTDVRIFGNFFSDPNTFYLLSFFDDNNYPLSGNRGVREFKVGGNRSNAENFKFQVRTIKNKTYDSENNEYVNAPTSRYEVKIELLRKNPISVFVALDSPEAVSFVRTDEFASLTSEEKKKKLQEMLEAGDAYLLTKYGDPFPGTGADTSFDDVALPESWEVAAGVDVIASIEELFNNFADLFGDVSAAAVQLQGYLEWLKDPTPVPTTTQLDDGDKADILNASDEFLGEYFNEDGSPKDYMTDDLVIIYISQALQAGIYNSTAATNIHGGIPTSDSKIPIHNNITFNEGISPDGLGGINIIDGYDFPTASQFEIGSSGETIGEIIASGATGVSADEIMGQPRMPIQTNISAYELEGTLLGSVLNYNNLIDVGQPQFEQLIRSGGTIMENKKIKSPKAFFKDKDIKPEFPENPPPPQIKGLHPDLVTGEKTAQRFNKLDPISARAMPRTGIKAIDKKVQIAKKKPK